MKILDFKRDEQNNIIAVGAKGKEVVLPFEYVAVHKPQIGDVYVPTEKADPVIAQEIESTPE